jgi:multiple sugar transport system substrate-binding protein
MAEIVLNGITWAHSRGITPLLAAAQRFSELYPGITIHWKKRSLQEFADFPLEKLTDHYDLLIIDHPWVGCAAATGAVIPLDEYLPAAYLDDQAGNSTGESHESYRYEKHQWALAIDAATPAASYREDLFIKNNTPVPQTWNDVLQLAQQGKLAIPAIPIDLLMNFYMFCIAQGETPFVQNEQVVSSETGMKAMESMRSLYSLIDKQFFSCNPIAVAELMSTTDDYWYCPFAYCYSNYTRNGFAKKLLTYTDLVTFNKGERLRSTIGGTGIAVSSSSRHKEIAVRFSSWICSGEIQKTLYVQHGGQPGHRSAWLDEQANVLTNQFLRNILPTMDRGYMRPRYNGYLHFQDHAGQPLQDYLLGKTSAAFALEDMNRIYRQSQIIRTTNHKPQTPNPKLFI